MDTPGMSEQHTTTEPRHTLRTPVALPTGLSEEGKRLLQEATGKPQVPLAGESLDDFKATDVGAEWKRQFDAQAAKEIRPMQDDVLAKALVDTFELKTWTVDNLLAHHDSLTARARELMTRKNHDYAGANGLSPFANFETSEALGVVSTEQGIMVRLLDKVKRICSFLEAGEFKVEDEKLDDTVLDLINYTVILSGYLNQKANQ